MSDWSQLSKTELISRLEAWDATRAANSSAAPLSPTPIKGAVTRMLLGGSNDAIIVTDEQGTIDACNPAAEKLFNQQAADLLGQGIGLLICSSANGQEIQGRRRDGSLIPLDVSLCETQEGERRIFACFARDATERKRADAELAQLAQSLAEKNKELETIVYVASHDLRSPLVNIQGFGRELSFACAKLRERMAASAPPNDGELRTALDQDIPEALSFIQAGVLKIDALLAGFLRYSRLGRAALKIERLDMDKMLGAITSAMEFQIQQTAAKLDVHPLPACLADATQLNQVFSNLLDNAVKYREPGRACEISVTGYVQEGRAIYEVRDNGIGIALEHQGKIFEIFHRLNPTQGEGEGLGLTIAQRILERQNGRIWVQSQPGQGSRFFVSLPAASPT